MKSFTSSMAVASATLLKLASAEMYNAPLYAFADEGCDTSKYFEPWAAGPGYPSCTANEFSDPVYNLTAGGAYQIYWGIPQPDEGCKFFLRSPANVDDPGCGNVIGSFSEATCALIETQSPVDLNWCCGDEDCDAALNPGSKKRSAEAPKAVRDPMAMKRTRRAAVAQTLARRQAPSDCAYAAAGDTYTAESDAQKVTDEQSCSTSAGCQISLSTTIESSSTNTYSVDESTEAGLFDIISETVSFGYSYSYETSQSSTMQFTYTIPEGATGYLTFTPTVICTQGSFSGTGCAAGGVPETSGNACVPKLLSDGKTPDGTVNFVYSD